MAAQAAAAGAAFEQDIHHDPKQKPQNVCVLGGGNFGTAMAFLAASKSHSVRWYCRDPKQAATITSTRRNPRYLSDIELPEGLQATANVSEALQGATLVISALPAQATPHFIEKYRGDIPADAIFCCTSKGLYLEEGCFLSEAMLRAFQRPQTLAFFVRTVLRAPDLRTAPDGVSVCFGEVGRRGPGAVRPVVKTVPRLRVPGYRGSGIGRRPEESIGDRRGHDRGRGIWHKYPGGLRHARDAGAHRVMCGHGRAARDDLGLGGCR
mmetsp:Transcript_21391/g.63925  ORF Transcript_21391/g.63925 Transcript_21391/m.63925 type:complete len:266 (-) Transcript_21391:306-1103(-)